MKSRRFIKGSYNLTNAGFETTPERALIQRRRLQILIHSCLYYRMCESLISDDLWQQWANELVQLQKEYPEISQAVDYHEEFKDFDESTGFDLPLGNTEVVNKAMQLLEYRRKRENGLPRENRGTKTTGGKVVRVRLPD